MEDCQKAQKLMDYIQWTLTDEGVITSYSIHYTKLYDVDERIGGAEIDRQVVGEVTAQESDHVLGGRRQLG